MARALSRRAVVALLTGPPARRLQCPAHWLPRPAAPLHKAGPGRLPAGRGPWRPGPANRIANRCCAFHACLAKQGIGRWEDATSHGDTRCHARKQPTTVATPHALRHAAARSEYEDLVREFGLGHVVMQAAQALAKVGLGPLAAPPEMR